MSSLCSLSAWLEISDIETLVARIATLEEHTNHSPAIETYLTYQSEVTFLNLLTVKWIKMPHSSFAIQYVHPGTSVTHPPRLNFTKPNLSGMSQWNTAILQTKFVLYFHSLACQSATSVNLLSIFPCLVTPFGMVALSTFSDRTASRKTAARHP